MVFTGATVPSIIFHALGDFILIKLVPLSHAQFLAAHWTYLLLYLATIQK